MKFIVDHNLSPKLVPHLADRFPGTVHTLDLGFDRTTDHELWRFAKENDFHVLTKDTDFERLGLLRGAPPKVIWLRVGNAPTHAVLELLDKHHADIVTFLNSEEGSVLALSS